MGAIVQIVMLAVLGSCAIGALGMKEVPFVMKLDEEKSDSFGIPGMSHITISGAVRHGNKEVEMWVETLPPGMGTPIHRHDCEEIFVVLKGTGTALLAPTSKENLPQQFPFSANSTFTIPPNAVHKIINTGKVEDMHFFVTISRPPMKSYVYEGWSTPHDEAVHAMLPWDREPASNEKEEL